MRVLILLALLGTALAVPKKIQRIVGGTATEIERFPFMSNMQYPYWGSWWMQACGGSLITRNAVLSAAHCYIGDSPAEWRVLLGTSFASSGGSIHDVSQIILHPNYSNNRLTNDVAIIRLRTPAIYSHTIQPARIPGSHYIVPDNTDVVTVGWGVDAGGFNREELQYVTVQTINQRVCAERYDHLRTQPGYAHWPDITDDMICSGILNVGGKDSCQGDSGGPLLHHGDIVVGIVSWGYSCAHYYYPRVNSRVSYNSHWISVHGAS